MAFKAGFIDIEYRRLIKIYILYYILKFNQVFFTEISKPFILYNIYFFYSKYRKYSIPGYLLYWLERIEGFLKVSNIGLLLLI
jgi:hypothetical protein